MEFWLGTFWLGLAHSVRRPGGRTSRMCDERNRRRWNIEHIDFGSVIGVREFYQPYFWQ
jgi:hypothetical protein